MPQLSLAVKSITVTQGTALKFSSALFTVGATDYLMSIAVFGGSLYQNGAEIGASGSFTLAELKLGKISFLADGTSLPGFYFQASSLGIAPSAEVQPILTYKAVNQAPVVSIPGLGSDGDALLNGCTVTITREMIDATDAETPGAGNLQVKITTVKGGGFLLNGFAAKTFSLADVEAGSVSFKHDGKFLAPSFSLSVSDSDGKASLVKASKASTIFFDGAENAAPQVLDPHEIAVKAPFTISEGATLKLSASNLPILVSVNVVPLLAQPGLNLRIDKAEHCEILVAGSVAESFTLAQLKANLVTLKHDGSQEAPQLELSLLNGDTELDAISVPFAFKTLNDLPTLSLKNLVLNAGETTLIDRSLFNAADEETPEAIEGAFVFTVKSAVGLVFLRDGSSIPLKSFTLADVDANLISAQRISGFIGEPSYSVTVTDPNGKISGLSKGLCVGNHAVTGQVQIHGSNSLGQTLTASHTLADSDGLGPVTYTWFNDAGTKIGQGSTLELGAAHLGERVQVVASFVDGNNFYESKASAFTPIIIKPNHLPAGTVNISGTAIQGSTLLATSNLSDADGLADLSYAWKDSEGLTVATGSSLLLTQNHVGKVLRVVAFYTDDLGNAESVSSATTANIGDVNDSSTGSVSISGNTIQGQTLNAVSSLFDADGLGPITYTWKDENGVILGHGSSLSLAQAHVGKKIQLFASYTDGQGHLEASSSALSNVIADINDSPSGQVSFSGNLRIGSTLSASQLLSDADGLGAISYKWYSQAHQLLGTGETYTIASNLLGSSLYVQAGYIDNGGFVEQVNSALSTTIRSANAAPSGSVTVSGTPTQGQTLTASHNLTDADSPNGITGIVFKWVDESGATLATGSNLNLTQAFVGKTLKCVVAYTDAGGSSEAVSSASSLIANVNDTPSGIVSILGSPLIFETLTAANTLGDVDGLGTISYTWKDEAGNVLGQGQSLNLGPSHLGKKIVLHAAYTDALGTQETVASSASAAVSSINHAPTGEVIIHGLTAIGSTLTVTNTLADIDGLGAVNYTWKDQNGNTVGYGSSLYLSPSLKNLQITAIATYSDSLDTLESVSALPITTSDGIEIRANTYTRNTQGYSAVVTLKDGSFIVAWSSSGQDGDSYGVYAQMFASDCTRLGSEFRVNTTTVNSQGDSDITVLSNGNYVIVWNSDGQDGSSNGIFGQVFSPNGDRIGGEFQINSYTSSNQQLPKISSLNDGGFVVVWDSSGQDATSSWGVYGQRFNENATKFGSEFRVNSSTVGYQYSSDLISTMDGGFIVSWSDNSGGSDYSVKIQRYSNVSASVGGETKVNTYSLNDQDSSDMSLLSNGGYVVVWESYGQDGSYNGLYGQIYNSSGVMIGSEFGINVTTQYDQENPVVTTLSNGNFVVSWESDIDLPSGNGIGIYARIFNSTGLALTEEIHVNSYINSDQTAPSIAAMDDGGFVVAWDSYGEDGYYDGNYIYDGVYLQRYTADGQVMAATWNCLPNAGKITGTEGRDIIKEIGSGDVLLGNGGDDIFSFATNSPTIDFALIDGGTGKDTVKISTHLDLTLIPNDRLTNIEVIDLGSNAVNLKMELADVLTLSGGTGTVKITGSNALGNWDKEAGWIFVELANGFEKYTKGDATVYLQNELGVI
ncbi:MAG: hypothetical protein RL095_449 [Verrucomicrobiota bacterium]